MINVKFSPQVKADERIKYAFLGEIIRAEIYDLVEVKDEPVSEGIPEVVIEEVLNSTLYIDLSSVEEGKLYQPVHTLMNATRDSEGLNVELLNYIGSLASEEERFSAWTKVEDEEFEIEEDAEVIELEAMVMPEPPAPPFNPESLQAENFELNRKIAAMQSSMMKSQRETEDLILTLMMMM